MLMVFNDPTLVMRVMMPILSVATGCGIVAAGITLGVIVAQQGSPFQDTRIVLQSPSTVVLNRYIQLDEVGYFYNVLDTLDLFIADIKQVLATRFGKNFINVLLTDFSSEPIVTSSGQEKSASSLSIETSILSTKYNTTNYTTNAIQLNARSISVNISNCENRLGGYDNKCLNQIQQIQNCVNASINVLKCLNETTTVYNCTYRTNNTINCDNVTITIAEKSDNELDVHNDILLSIKTSTTTASTTSTTSTSTTTTTTTTTTTSTTTTTTTTTIFDNNAVQCKPPEDATVQPSIIISQMFLYFAVKKTESITVVQIIDALKNLKSSVTLFNICDEPSTQDSSFNSTLSMIEPLVPIQTQLDVLVNLPSIPVSLQESINNASITAAIDAGLFSNITYNAL